MSSEENLTNGVLYAKMSAENYTLKRVAPSPALAGLVDTFWSVKWDLRGQKPHIQQNIPDPCIHMVFEPGRSRIVGVVTKRFTRELAGRGCIFGIKFRAGGFYPILKSPVSKFRDENLLMNDVFGSDGDSFTEHILNAKSIESQINIAEKFLSPFIPLSKQTIDQIGQIISEIETNKNITKVDQIVEKVSLNTRALQRLFNNYVGVSPKWVIRKYRIHEILTRLENGASDWQDLVAQLDYFDQAHFIKDFKDMVGVTPTDYISRLDLRLH